jgi:hypothetical protein
MSAECPAVQVMRPVTSVTLRKRLTAQLSGHMSSQPANALHSPAVRGDVRIKGSMAHLCNGFADIIEDDSAREPRLWLVIHQCHLCSRLRAQP